ncbi:MAG: hypothetical protein ACN4GT_01650 [Gammaproteobacteria bacterium]
MSCGGSMMRASMQPLAHLVDAAAETWLAVEAAPEAERSAVRATITGQFRIGDQPELTFHGRRYILRIFHAAAPRPTDSSVIDVEVHEIAINN